MKNTDRAMIFKLAWAEYEYSKKPWQFEISFAEALKAQWDAYKADKANY